MPEPPVAGDGVGFVVDRSTNRRRSRPALPCLRPALPVRMRSRAKSVAPGSGDVLPTPFKRVRFVLEHLADGGRASGFAMHSPTDNDPPSEIPAPPTSRLGRRRFAFWVGFGLFSLGERLRAESLDSLAAAVMRAGGEDTPPPPKAASPSEPGDDENPDPPADDPSADDPRPAEHWTFEENERWYWFERETFVEGQWKLTGRTRPVHKHTGTRAPDVAGYVPDDEVPASVLRPPPGNDDGDGPNDRDRVNDGGEAHRQPSEKEPAAEPRHFEPHDAKLGDAKLGDAKLGDGAAPEATSSASQPPPPASDPSEDPLTPGQASPERRARHGRPPSRWLRSLRGGELRSWLATVDVPEAGVSGMSFWVHLTRDHRFHPKNIAGLTTEEQAKLHAAAHHGY